MTKFKLICSDCNAVIITSSPEAMVWELCPGCHKHIWDMYDALMADVATEKHVDSKRMGASVSMYSN